MRKGTKHSPEAIEKNRISSTGRKHTLETKLKISQNHSHYWKGRIHPTKGVKTGRVPVTAFKKGEHSSHKTEFKKGNPGFWLGKTRHNMTGENHPNWRGTTSENQLIRTSAAYKRWRKAVFDRDDYTCQACGIRGAELHADHELPFAVYPDLRFEVLNGRALCVPCHKKTPTWGNKSAWLVREAMTP